MNHQIHVKEVRLIGEDNEPLGVVDIEKAREMAASAGCDLVEISPTAQPPVCRIIDYGKYLYLQSKKDAIAKKKQKQLQTKELKFRPGIEEGDYGVKLRKLLEFIAEGDKVKITIRFRGREIMYHDLAFKLAERLQIDIGEQGVLEQAAKFEGKQITMMFGPKKK